MTRLDLTLTDSTVSGFDVGLYLEEAAGEITGSASGNIISGNLSAGAWSNTAVPFDARGNDWGDVSGPFSAEHNPLGLGDAVEGSILFTPWTGRTTSVVADLEATPNGAYFWEGTPAIGVDDDGAPGFSPGRDPRPRTPTPSTASTPRPFSAARSRSASCTESPTSPKRERCTRSMQADWFFQLYTDPYTGSPGSTWYGNRINSEPYFSDEPDRDRRRVDHVAD